MGLVHITAYAAISEDGMLANAAGVMPEALKVKADQSFYESGLKAADVLVHGAHSQEPFASTARKQRLLLTRQTASISAHPSNPCALFWNPAGATLAQALAAHNRAHADTHIAVIGATEAFQLFLDDYETFFLSRVANVRLPGGRPVFRDAPARTPELILSAHGMAPDAEIVSTPEVTITRWRRVSVHARGRFEGADMGLGSDFGLGSERSPGGEPARAL